MRRAKPEQKDLTLDVWRTSKTEKELLAYRRKLAKRANQRLVRLERAVSPVTGEKLSGIGASERAYAYLNRQQKGRRRFQEKEDVKLSYHALRNEISQLQGFLQSQSSLVSGLRDIERKRIETFESGNWGSGVWTGKEHRKLKFASTKEFYDFFNSGVFRELEKAGFTSEQIIESYDEARETYKGSDREAMDALAGALEKFRSQSASLKELRAAARGAPLK